MPDVPASLRPVSGQVASLIDGMAAPAALLSKEGEWRHANQALAAMLQDVPEALVGTPAHRRLGPEVAGAIDTALADLANRGEGTRNLRVASADAAGRAMHLRIDLSALADGDDALLQLQDVTAGQAAGVLEQALAFGISHELRAPIRAVEQFSRRLLAPGARHEPAVVQDHVQRIHDAAVQAGSLIEGLVEMIHAGRPARAAANADISLLADWICAELQDSDPGRAAEIRIAPDLRAWGDEHALKQLLGKLLHNAWKFSSQRDTVRITLDGERIGDRLQLRLRDAGRGFDMRYAERLFVPFRRLHSADDGAGHGLGLAIAQQLARAQGGHIRVESEPDAGATFFIELPAVPDEDTAAP